ncbi:ORF6C domain-containing protein (plasmid) [Apilactobacillus apisilvae]|uniref:ORF6C domain-containing protein n=1 Tax=Apilactobacillus apisilvae TaxID=2923364 RepID=A0ABY4PK77_9LACO|nr:BRO family protein [Apilactobacillus apisilvae]UQS85809.1 ORF6C domain-containing protein [Apilactobacillus apisilvae]
MVLKRNDLTPINNFNFRGEDIFTIEINNKVWFWGKQVAKLLQYKKPNNAVTTLIKENHRKTLSQSACPDLGLAKMLWNGYDHSAKTLIDISGVYSLIMRSNLPQAEQFQDWVTDEVLPSIQRTGGYQVEKEKPKPMSATERLSLATQAVGELDGRVSKLESNQTINPGEYSYLNSLVSKQVYSYANNVLVHYNRKQIKELYKDISNGIKQVSNIKTRSQLRAGQYNDVIDYVTSWVPSTATKQVVKSIQLNLGGEYDD